MKIVTVLAALAAGAAAGYLKWRSEKRAAEKIGDPHTYVLQDEEAMIVQPEDLVEDESAKWRLEGDEEGEEPGDVTQSETVSAAVTQSSRAMDPLTLQGASRVTFECEDGKKRKFFIPGRNGAFLVQGDRGELTFAGSSFISFEKEDGEFVSPLFHTVPEKRKA